MFYNGILSTEGNTLRCSPCYGPIQKDYIWWALKCSSVFKGQAALGISEEMIVKVAEAVEATEGVAVQVN